MANKNTKNSLGKGLDALFNERANDSSSHMSIDASSQSQDLNILPIDKIYPSSLQPRKYFDESKIIELASSIQERG